MYAYHNGRATFGYNLDRPRKREKPMDHEVPAGRDGNGTKPVLRMAMELSLGKWKLGFSDGSARAPRGVTIEARD